MNGRRRGVTRSRLIALIGALSAALATLSEAPPSYRIAATASMVVLSACDGQSTCRSFKGPCTGVFAKRQCTVAPVSLQPDAATTEQCCGGAFQYPSIEVCEGQPPQKGCSFCVF
jgi:hypothetical protein